MFYSLGKIFRKSATSATNVVVIGFNARAVGAEHSRSHVTKKPDQTVLHSKSDSKRLGFGSACSSLSKECLFAKFFNETIYKYFTFV